MVEFLEDTNSNLIQEADKLKSPTAILKNEFIV